MNGLLQRSLKTRITLLSLVIFALSLWALAFYASKMLRVDMEQLLGDQQFSTVAMVAANMDHELKERISALESVAADFEDQEVKSSKALQGIIERRPVLALLFNAGYYATDAAGTAIASVPVEAGRIGVNYSFRNHVAGALGEGKSGVSEVDIGKVLQVPVVSLAVPIRNAQGKVVGALVGVVNVSENSFLDRVTSKAYGQTGGYLLVARQQRKIITATDKSRVMEALPPAGVNPTIDRFLAGREGSDVLTSPTGAGVLVSVKGLSGADWYVAATLPVEEAFAPIEQLEARMLQATILLTLIVGSLIWWILRRQLAPLSAAAAALGARPDSGLIPKPLPVSTQDEIGTLVSAFNSLLDALRRSFKDLGEAQRIAHIGSWHLNLASNQVTWSDELFNIYGLDPSLPIPSYSEHMKLLAPESWDRLSAAITQTSKTGVPYTLELELIKTDGSKGVMWVHGEPEVNAAGKITGIWGAAQDITQLRANEAVLRIQAQRAKILLQLPKVAGTMSEKAFMQYAQEQVEDLTGSKIAFIHLVNRGGEEIELVAWSRRTLEHYCTASYDSHYPLGSAGIWADALREGKAVIFNDYPSYPHKRGLPTGHSALQRLISVPVFEDGNAVLVAGVGNKDTDYTALDSESVQLVATEIWHNVKRLRTEGAIARFTRALDRSKTEIYLLDPKTWLFVDANQGAIKKIGYTMKELSSMTALDLKPELTPESWATLLAPLLSAEKQFISFVTQHRSKDGRLFPVEVHLEMTHDEPPLLMDVVQDITERNKADLKLLQQLEELTRWQQAMLGREDRIISIKQEVNALLVQAGQPPRYATQLPSQPDEAGT